MDRTNADTLTCLCMRAPFMLATHCVKMKFISYIYISYFRNVFHQLKLSEIDAIHHYYSFKGFTGPVCLQKRNNRSVSQ